MKKNIRVNQGFTLVEIISALAFLAVLIVAAVLGIGAYNNAQLESCNIKLKSMKESKETYEATKASGDSYQASKQCKEYNKFVDDFNKAGCPKILGIKPVKKDDCGN